MEEDIKTIERKPKEMVFGEKAKFDKKDLKILKILEDNGRTTIIDIAAKVGLSKDAVKYRINRMVENGIINGFTTVVNSPMLGYPFVNITLLALTNLTPQKEEKFVDYLKSHENITHISAVSGAWDYLIVLSTRDPGQFNDVIKEIRQQFPEIIKDLTSTSMMKEIKYDDHSGIIKQLEKHLKS